MFYFFRIRFYWPPTPCLMSILYSGGVRVRTKRTKRTATERILYIFLWLFNLDVHIYADGFSSSSILCGACRPSDFRVSVRFHYILIQFDTIINNNIMQSMLRLSVRIIRSFWIGLLCNVWHFQHRKERRRGEKRPPDTQNETNWLLCTYSLTRSQPAAHLALWWFIGDHSRHICFGCTHSYEMKTKSISNMYQRIQVYLK